MPRGDRRRFGGAVVGWPTLLVALLCLAMSYDALSGWWGSLVEHQGPLLLVVLGVALALGFGANGGGGGPGRAPPGRLAAGEPAGPPRRSSSSSSTGSADGKMDPTNRAHG